MNQKTRYLLAIESAIAGGSLALFEDNDVIASRCGEGSVSRAEDLLPNIISMLEETGIAKGDLSRVAISLGPGSYTGLRIGIATAMGLKRALNIEYVGVPLFRALASGLEKAAIIAIPMGKADICFADSTGADAPRVVSLAEIVETIRDEEPGSVLIHPVLHERFQSSRPQTAEPFRSLDPTLAGYVGRAALSLPPSDSLDPIYIQNPRFG